jgi:CubicO group peptidase (beta-lactamase class C family)
MADALAAETPWWEPGTQQGYHAVTFGFLVGELIRRASGMTVGQLFRQEIAEPLQADFQIGLPPSEDRRVSDLIGSLAPPKLDRPKKGVEDAPKAPRARVKGPLGDFFRDMGDPTTMVGAAFSNPRQPHGIANSRAWRGAEIPAANGHGTATALARIYGTLARGGERAGVRILEKESIDLARTEQGHTPDLILGGLRIRYGLGFMLRSKVLPFSPHEGAFGHPGAGGSLGMADPEARVGFGYVMNRMKPGLMGGSTAFAALDAFYAALGQPLG